MMIDSLARGSLHQKTPEEALKLMEIVAAINFFMYSFERSSIKGVMALEIMDAILVQNKIMTQQLSSLTK
ncbi:hypothetical protein AHAS_Ahas03G0154600 [Arachis hypogaea]